MSMDNRQKYLIDLSDPYWRDWYDRDDPYWREWFEREHDVDREVTRC